MIILNTYAAQPIRDSQPNAQIFIKKPFPEILNLKEAMEKHDNSGKLLEDVLHKTLPGGTYDALLRHMLDRRKSHFVISFADFPGV